MTEYADHIYYRKVDDHAKNMPSAVYFGKKSGDKFSIAESIKYKYDKMGNICRLDENGAPVVWYKYDALNRLVREDNKSFGKTWLYSYDNKGNILCKRETSFTLKENAEESEFESVQYEYEGDKLLTYGLEACEYDALGNPTTYRGKTVQWANGRQMTNYDGTAFTYDGLGRRLSKGSINYTYDSNGRVIKQSNGIEFIYDNSGVAGIVYNSGTYLYRKDGQGNICALIDSSGNIVVQYKYDAWGNHAALYWNKVNDKEQYSEVDVAAFDENYAHNKTLAELNPFRYRGYYYDTETGLYYLKTRYYDPEVGRFITIDDISYLDPETINGLNLYAYCGNNPVMRVDSSGNKWWHWLLGGLIIVASAILTVVTAGGFAAAGTAILSVFTATMAPTALSAVFAGALVGSVALGTAGLLIGGFSGGDGWSWDNAATGFMWGTVIGAVAGSAWGGMHYALQNAGKMAIKTKIGNLVNNPLDEFVTKGPKDGAISGYMRSISQTGDYGQIFAKKIGNGMFEIANGHHRVAALIKLGYRFVKFFLVH